MLTCAIFNLLFGKIYQLYDTKWTFLIAILIFEIGSAICGGAPTSTVREYTEEVASGHTS